MLIGGCGGGGKAAVVPVTTTVTITGIAGSITHVTTYELTVQ